MIVITGGAGFIGSAVAWRLNQLGVQEIIIVDNFKPENRYWSKNESSIEEQFEHSDKWKNLVNLKFFDIFDSEEFGQMCSHDFLKRSGVDTVIHLGACSSTTERNFDLLLRNNYEFTKYLCEKSLSSNVRFIYASSAATYGAGERGYVDDESGILDLKPLNPYAYSKQLFDQWIVQNVLTDKVVGLKYFNVFGPNEYHKGDMRSLVSKGFEQIKESGKIKLFKSYSEKYGDGEQKRDFIYIKDAVDMTLFFWQNKVVNGIYNIGTGQANTFNDLVKPIFTAMDVEENIEYVEMPEQLRTRYQDFTQADMTKLRKAGYNKESTPITEAVIDYVDSYLNDTDHYL